MPPDALPQTQGGLLLAVYMVIGLFIINLLPACSSGGDVLRCTPDRDHSSGSNLTRYGSSLLLGRSGTPVSSTTTR